MEVESGVSGKEGGREGVGRRGFRVMVIVFWGGWVEEGWGAVVEEEVLVLGICMGGEKG